ncbi:hypothetical protein GCM10007908_10350 [Rhizobium albus]|nr:hypothetical protein GCM10007908_10350 [Rhizobium albus]
MDVVMKRRMLLAVLTVGALWPLMPKAQAEKADRWFTGLVNGVAVGGYDPVAYFTEGRPRRGDPAIALTHEGAVFHFATVENRQAFSADPDRYAPQFGGYCAYAVAEGYTAKGEPEIWDIVDGRLYLNYSRGVQRTWQSDIPGYVRSAQTNWPRLSK